MSQVTALENTIDHRKEEKHMFNTLPGKLLGINLIHNPKVVKLCGFNVYLMVFGSFIIYVSLVTLLTCTNGFYYWTNHRTEAILYFGIMENLLFTCYKMSIIIRKSR